MLDMYLLGTVIVILVYFFDDEAMRLDFGILSKFLAFMALVTAFRLVISTIMPFPDVSDMPLKFWRFGFVWWEDAVFGIPLYYTLKWKERPRLKYAWYALAAVLSIWFALGHTYQGYLGLVTIIYPVFISLKYGKKHGFGTVMAAHVLYDMITYATFKFAPVIIS